MTLDRLSKATGLSFQRLHFKLPIPVIRPRLVTKDTGHIYEKAGLRDAILASNPNRSGPLAWNKM